MVKSGIANYRSKNDHSPELCTVLNLLHRLPRHELMIVADELSRLFGGRDKIERVLESYLISRTKLLNGGGQATARIPTVRECMAYLRYYYLRHLKPRDRDKVLSTYRPLAKKVRYRVRKRLAYHRRRGNLREYLESR